MHVYNFIKNNIWGENCRLGYGSGNNWVYCRDGGDIFTSKNSRKVIIKQGTAISESEHVAVPSERSNSVMLGHTLTLEFTYCQKAFGLDFKF